MKDDGGRAEMDKEYKTSKTQRNAVKAYRERTKQKNFCVTVSKNQYEEDKSLLDAHGLTTGKFWRWGIEKLKAEPINREEATQESDK